MAKNSPNHPFNRRTRFQLSRRCPTNGCNNRPNAGFLFCWRCSNKISAPRQVPNKKYPAQPVIPKVPSNITALSFVETDKGLIRRDKIAEFDEDLERLLEEQEKEQ